MFKAIVGVAAVAVIAFVGYFFWREYETNQAKLLAAAERTAAAQEEQTRLLKEVQDRAMAVCLDLGADYVAAVGGKSLGYRFSQADAKRNLTDCAQRGFITKEQLAGFGIE